MSARNGWLTPQKAMFDGKRLTTRAANLLQNEGYSTWQQIEEAVNDMSFLSYRRHIPNLGKTSYDHLARILQKKGILIPKW